MTFPHPDAVKVTIRDRQTGTVAPGMDGFNAYWWSEGNGSCDCNRGDLFPDDLPEGEGEYSLDWMDDEPFGPICRGRVRFEIITVEPMPEGMTLADFNRGYPPR